MTVCLTCGEALEWVEYDGEHEWRTIPRIKGLLGDLCVDDVDRDVNGGIKVYWSQHLVAPVEVNK